MARSLTLIATPLLLAACAHGQTAAAPEPAFDGLTINLTAPVTTPESAGVYVAGTFNAWNPGAPAYRLTRLSPGRYTIALPAAVRGTVEFKFTLGSWSRVELTAARGGVPNRTFTIPPAGSATYDGEVGAWQDSAPPPPAHTTRPTVAILADAFVMPHLGRTRRVWIYVPPDYATSTKTYPVLYMQDGQNVFDAATSFAGEWGVDEALDSLQALGDWGAIVVAVDNGGQERANEYMPWPGSLNGQLIGGGQARQYVDFLALTLKPYVDGHYRTRPGRLDTGVGGSSLGGLFALYAALVYPDVYGRVLAFSPAFFINPQIFPLARALTPRQPPTRYYMLSGLAESGPTLPPNTFAVQQDAMRDTLVRAGVDTADVRSLAPADGQHAEWFWRREFPAAYRWLFRPAEGR